MKIRIALAVLLLPLLFSAETFGAGILKQPVDGGPRAKRINMVAVAEGYTAAEQDKFDADTQAIFNYVFNDPYYVEYQAFYNAFSIFVASNQSGADHPQQGIFKDTYFNCYYGYGDVDRAMAIDNIGENRLYDVLADLLPEYDIIVIVVNDPTWGGTSFGKYALICTDPRAPEIFVHEVGHSFANLGDEYDEAYPGYPDIEEPNTTRETNRANIKWKNWIDASTPVPTPITYTNVVGLFQGAHYHTSGWYRPRLNCCMRDSSYNFCEVCREAHVIALYQSVSCIDEFLPATTAVNITQSQSQSFGVATLRPNSLPHRIDWEVDGVPVAQNTPTYLAAGTQLGAGVHTVTAVVTDPTTFVRTDPTHALIQRVTWTLGIDPGPPVINSPLTATGKVGVPFSYFITAVNFPTSFTTSGLPPGLLLDAGAGEIAGTPTVAGTYPVTLGATNTLGTGSAILNLTIDKGDVTIIWSTPADILVLTPLGGAQLNATASTPGTFTYDPPAGTILPLGPLQILKTAFTPAQAANYNPVSASVRINVNRRTPVLAWNDPADIIVGTALGNSQLNATADAPGTFTYSPPAGTVLAAGLNQTLNVSFVASDPNYISASVTGSALIDVLKAAVLTWQQPADIVYGTALSAAQLHATANTPGVFTYTPAIGTVLNAGAGQILSAEFVPAAPEFATATVQTTINVLKLDQTITFESLADVRLGFPPITLAATASSGLPVGYTVVDGSASVSGSVLTISGGGTIVLRAEQSGNNNFKAALPVERSFGVYVLPPTVSGTIVANPQPAFSGKPVTFSLAATDLLPLTYTWNFGDGIQSSAPSPSHTFSPAGSYDVSVKASNSGGLFETRTLALEVIAGPSLIGNGGDTDGDGFSDDVEAAASSQAGEANSKPFAMTAVEPPVINTLKLAVKLNFAKPGADTITLSGTFACPSDYYAANAKVVFDVGGVVAGFALDLKGGAKAGASSVKMQAAMDRKTSQKAAKFTLKLSGDYAGKLANYGMTNTNAKGVAVTVPVFVVTEQNVYKANVRLSYTAKLGKSGAGKQAK